MNANLLDALDSHGHLFSSEEELWGSRSAALTEFYRLMRDISAGELLDDSEARTKLEEHLPWPLSVLSQMARRAFSVRSTIEMETHLRDVLNLLHAEEHWQRLPEARILMLKGRDWLKQLHVREPGHFSCRPAPSLKLDICEEREKETDLTLSFVYSGMVSATNVRLYYRGVGGLEVSAREAEQERVEGKWKYIKIGDGISEGGVCLGRLGLVHHGPGTLIYELHHDNYIGQKTPQFLRDCTYEASSIAESPSLDVQNPFIPDGPIHLDPYWKTLAHGHHVSVVERFVAELLGNPRPLAIRGLRRSGKTTVLLRFSQVLAERHGVLAVHIGIREWWFELRKLNRPIEESGLLYEIAGAILREALNLPSPSKCDSFFAQFEEKMLIGRADFLQFLRIFREEAGLKPVLLLDDLDFWLRQEQFADNSWRLLIDLSDQQLCSVVVAHTWTGDEWDERIEEQGIFPFGARLEMLDYSDVMKLIDLLPVVRTGMAKELVWRLTGGWQGLLQLFLYCMHEEFLRSRRRDVALIKHVARELLNSADWRPLVKYLVESFRQDEVVILRYLAERQLVDLETCEISGACFCTHDGTFSQKWGIGEGPSSYSEALGSLKEKRIIEQFAPGAGRLRLRVGFLAYPPLWLAKPTEV